MTTKTRQTRPTLKQRAPCLNPDYCGTADADTLCANCRPRAEHPAEPIEYWGEADRQYPEADWQRDVADGNTRQGYWEWVAASRERDAE